MDEITDGRGFEPLFFHIQAESYRQCPFQRAAAARPYQGLVQQDEVVLFPVQALDPVPPPSAEQEQRVGKWVQFKLLLDEARQAVYAYLCSRRQYRLYLRR